MCSLPSVSTYSTVFKFDIEGPSGCATHGEGTGGEHRERTAGLSIGIDNPYIVLQIRYRPIGAGVIFFFLDQVDGFVGGVKRFVQNKFYIFVTADIEVEGVVAIAIVFVLGRGNAFFYPIEGNGFRFGGG